FINNYISTFWSQCYFYCISQCVNSLFQFVACINIKCYFLRHVLSLFNCMNVWFNSCMGVGKYDLNVKLVSYPHKTLKRRLVFTYDAKDIGLSHNEKLLTIKLNFCSGILAIKYFVTGLNFWFLALLIFVANRNYGSLKRFFFCSIGNENSA